MASSKSVNDLLKQETMRKPKLPQLYVVLCKWSTAMNFEGKLITGPMLTEKANSFSSSNKNSWQDNILQGQYKKLPVTPKVTTGTAW